MTWDRMDILERLHMYPWLADEMRRNQPLGYLWGDLFADDAYFCEFNYLDVNVPRPSWEELVPSYPGNFGGPVASEHVPPGSGITTSCATGLGTYAPAALQNFASGFGEGGPFQRNNQQTRHTFTNIVFLMQSATAAQTLHYNIVERYVKGIAMDGSNFLYRINWVKVAGLWKMAYSHCIIFGHDRLTPLPSTAAFAEWEGWVYGTPFKGIPPSPPPLDIDVNPKVSRTPAAASSGSTSTQLKMLWDRAQVRAATSLRLPGSPCAS